MIYIDEEISIASSGVTIRGRTYPLKSVGRIAILSPEIWRMAVGIAIFGIAVLLLASLHVIGILLGVTMLVAGWLTISKSLPLTYRISIEVEGLTEAVISNDMYIESPCPVIFGAFTHYSDAEKVAGSIESALRWHSQPTKG